MDYTKSKKDEYNINVIENNIINDQSCLTRKGNNNSIKENLNEKRLSVIVATKEPNIEQVESVITMENRKSVEPFAYGDIQDKSL